MFGNNFSPCSRHSIAVLAVIAVLAMLGTVSAARAEVITLACGSVMQGGTVTIDTIKRTATMMHDGYTDGPVAAEITDQSYGWRISFSCATGRISQTCIWAFTVNRYSASAHKDEWRDGKFENSSDSKCELAKPQGPRF